MPPSEICFARARLMTESYRQTVGQPAILRRAKAFLAVAEGMPVRIGDDELVVGNISSKPRVAYFAPETFYWKQYRPGKELVLSDHRLSKDLAIRFTIPDEIAAFWRDQPRGDTAGHFVADYARVLRVGFNGLRAESERHRRRHEQAGTLDAQRKNFYEAVAITCRAAERFAQRHAQEARWLAQAATDPLRRAELDQIAAICQRVPAQPARTFREAIQAFWFTHALIHLNSSEWSISPGRFDQYMGACYEQDLAEGRLTRQQAAELLACLWIKFNEVRVGAIDFINYQNLIIGGTNAAGRDATNDLSHLCLETTARLRTLSQPSLSLRWHPATPPQLLEEACRLALTGSGRPALFSDNAIIPALVE
ncbi:MAG: glycyl radical protein, partial [Verrucomicrobia bacterium]|nr:glycyl radical protein [Verrucomicrobiota bacterium]